MDDRTLARWRMRRLHLVGPPCPSAPAVVDHLLAVQAENHAQASWAVAARTTGTTEEAFARLFDAGAILRTHVLRPTWHFVGPGDIRWLVALTAPRVRRALGQVQREVGLDDAALERGAEVVTGALAGDVHLTRDQLGQRLHEEGLPDGGQGLGVVLTHAELAGLVCSGPMQGPHHTHALLDERAPAGPGHDRAEALAQLVLRYLAGHGPATERDLAYWATLTLTDVRTGLAAVEDDVDHLEHDGRTYWFTDPPPGPEEDREPRAHLLQVLDEYHHGYQDSRGVLDADGLVPRGRPANMGMALVDGQMVAGMRRTIRDDEVVFELDTFRRLAGWERAALEDAASRCGRFLGRAATLTTTRATTRG